MPVDGYLYELGNYTKITITNNIMISKCGEFKEQASLHPSDLCIMPKFQMKTEGVTQPDVLFTCCQIPTHLDRSGIVFSIVDTDTTTGNSRKTRLQRW